MKKLAIVSTHPIQYNAPWIKLLNERGNIQVKVFYTWPPSQDGNKYDAGFGRMIKWDIPLLEGYPHVFTSATPQQSIKAQVEQWSPDALLVIGWRYKGHFACMRHFKGKIPILFRGDSTLTDEKKGLKRRVRRIILSLVYKYVDYSLYVGKNNKEYFKAHGLKEHQLLPAYHAVDNDRFYKNSVEKNERQELRRKLQIPAASFVVLFAGKLEKKKNPLIVLDLARQTAGSDIIFLVTGNGELEQILKTAAKDEPRIKFLDFQNQSQMPAVYAASDLLLLPSKGPGETWGLVANEAMACGLPVIISEKAGGAVDLVKGNGIVVNPDDVETISNFILTLKNDQIKYKMLKKNSLEGIKTFNFTRIAEAVEKACGL